MHSLPYPVTIFMAFVSSPDFPTDAQTRAASHSVHFKCDTVFFYGSYQVLLFDNFCTTSTTHSGILPQIKTMKSSSQSSHVFLRFYRTKHAQTFSNAFDTPTFVFVNIAVFYSKIFIIISVYSSVR